MMHNIGSALGSLEAQMQIVGNQLDALEARIATLEKRRANRAGCDKPTVEEVIAYCLTKCLTSDDGEDFFDRMENQEWKVNSIPVRDWRRVINTWKRGGYFPSQKVGGFQKISTTTTHITAQKELDRVLEAIRRIKAGYDPHQEMSMDDWNKLKPLRQRRDELKQQLGIKV